MGSAATAVAGPDNILLGNNLKSRHAAVSEGTEAFWLLRYQEHQRFLIPQAAQVTFGMTSRSVACLLHTTALSHKVT